MAYQIFRRYLADIVAVLYIALSIYHAVFVITQVNKIHLLLSPPQLETADELHIVLCRVFDVSPTYWQKKQKIHKQSLQ